MADIFSNLFGGLGLLLIGMSLMTDGLKLASGNALRDMLALWTNTRLRGLFSGFMITGVVQSSGVVTVATIGFANAGMLTLERAVWVVYGSNVGTTTTAWIVALIGFQLDIDALALPLTGLGAVLRFTGSRTWRSSAGTALVGFGLLFLGISFLKDAFDNLGSDYSLPVLAGGGWFQPVVYVAIGLVLTTVMQSSTAAMVITLGAAQGDLIPLGAAAAVVIGANLGTTTTALLAVVGATATAKRVAVSHVAFNLAAAVFAVLILDPMLRLVELLEMNLGLMPSAALSLAVFHTLFNIIGVLLMWPLTAPLVRLLDRRFSSTVDLAAKPKHLDKTVLALPFIAADAIALEVARLNHHTVKAFRASLRYRQDEPHSFDEHIVVRKLANAIGAYTVELSSRELTPFLSETLASLMESTQQYLLVVDILEDLAELSQSPREHFHHEVATAIDDYIDCISRHLDAQNLAAPECCIRGTASYDAVELYYRKLKDAILRSAARGELTMERMDGLLQYINQAKRASRQTLKATQRLLTVRDALQRDANGLVVSAHASEVSTDDETAAVTTRGLASDDEGTPTTTAAGGADASVALEQQKQIETTD